MQKVVFITGATSGIGEAIARIVSKNHKIIILGRQKDKLANLAHEIGANCIQTIAQDVCDIEAIKFELKDPLNIDVLINNAGLALGKEIAPNCELEDWHEMVRVNILGVLNLTHFFLPFFSKKRSGQIINIGSIAGSWPYPGGNVYGATKAFIKQFSLNLRADLFDKNVRVTNIEPGVTKTNFSLTRYKGNAAMADAIYEGINALDAEDIASAVNFVIDSKESVNINRIEIMPTTQALAGFSVHKKS
ncbi:MAG: SDR family NAD(P)-dependent oxidoreductase [Helicobacter sp.]|nr:SDR family NAD(P)-dependent oxidoreductase [Helicobacter sp.]